jgi:zinc protease
LLTLGLVPLPGIDPVEAETAMDAVLDDFLREGPEPHAFARLKTKFRAAEIYARDNVDGLAHRYGEALANGLTVADVQAWPEVLQQVTPEDVRAAAAEVLDRRRAVTGWLLPEEAAE